MRVWRIGWVTLAWARVAVAQGGPWVVTPARPTVGDTVWLERAIAVPPGWRVRAARLEVTADLEPLGDPAVLASATGWVVRYPVVAWTPGAHRLAVPPVWRLGPDGRADSTPGGTASVTVGSVLPDTARPEPRGQLGPLRSSHQDPVPPLLAILLAGGLIGAALAWRRRAPRLAAPSPEVARDPEVPDARWLAAGEPKAVAARAIWRLRIALAQAVPAAHPALSTAECLAALEQARPTTPPLADLRDLLEQLDRVAFASADGTDVAALATVARRVARELAP
ncbi:MAG TPA: hypothetical protein VH158_03420 [Gemmatimonadales bacterium]|jgi:hypothetical protein|nr:hypothetical protein [Gemmatimonadales bacterium]